MLTQRYHQYDSLLCCAVAVFEPFLLSFSLLIGQTEFILDVNKVVLSQKQKRNAQEKYPHTCGRIKTRRPSHSGFQDAGGETRDGLRGNSLSYFPGSV